MIKYLVILASFFGLSFSGDHALYFSVVELQIKEDGKASLLVKCFNDDLQDAVKNWNQYVYDIDKLHEADQRQIASYLLDKITITQNNEVLDLRFDEAQLEGATTWVHFQCNIQQSDTFSIHATQLMELFPQQKQMLRITGPNKKSHHILSIESSSEVFSGF